MRARTHNTLWEGGPASHQEVREERPGKGNTWYPPSNGLLGNQTSYCLGIFWEDYTWSFLLCQLLRREQTAKNKVTEFMLIWNIHIVQMSVQKCRNFLQLVVDAAGAERHTVNCEHFVTQLLLLLSVWYAKCKSTAWCLRGHGFTFSPVPTLTRPSVLDNF